MRFRQRDLMRELFHRFDGDREQVLAEYARLDDAGHVDRTRNGNQTSSREYAVRLWADGKNKGWLGEDALHLTSKTNEQVLVPTSKKGLIEVFPEFEDHLSILGKSWYENPMRPKLEDQELAYWSSLVENWCNSPTMPLLVRKGAIRAVERVHKSNRIVIPCDNSAAHWAFMGCYLKERPSLDEVYEQIYSGQLPLSMARNRIEKSLIESGEAKGLAGMMNGSLYGNTRNIDGKSYKVCHIKDIGMKKRGEAHTLPIELLTSHMKLFLDPMNMFVVPIRYSGIGECEAFKAHFQR